mmetsp:Transcript_9181/g.29605  ORF Transcript_9181/g.29605 Transcript_9181/m.29605 type:complete len:244 (-) Transcript_9181:691-1422(-)
MVPPMCVLDPSGMKITAGCSVVGSISVECASAWPHTFLANSITATCMPKQMPKYGISFSRAYFAAHIFPSTPLPPKPPGTNTPSALFNFAHASSYLSSFACLDSSSKSSASIHKIFNFLSHAIDECINAFVTDKYESPKPVYFPTTAIEHGTCTLSHFSALCFHASNFNGLGFICKCPRIAKCAFCSTIINGTCQIFETSIKFKILFGLTWQNNANFSITALSNADELLQANIVGANPALLSA